MQNIRFLLLGVGLQIVAASQPGITIARITEQKIEEARYYAENVRAIQQLRVKASVLVTGGVTVAFIAHMFSKTPKEQDLKLTELESNIASLGDNLKVMQDSVKDMQDRLNAVPVVPSAPPYSEEAIQQPAQSLYPAISPSNLDSDWQHVPLAPHVDNKWRRNSCCALGHVKKFGVGAVKGIGSALSYGFLSACALPSFYLGQKLLSSLLREVSLTTFVEDHTNFTTHVLAALESFEEYGAQYKTLTEEHKTIIFLSITHAGNCMMRDIERIIGYLNVIVQQSADERLTDYQLQEKQLLSDYILTLHRAGDHIADLLEEIPKVDYTKLMTLAPAFKEASQCIYNDCHVLTNIENTLNR
jgi:hypothetical protein